MLAEVTATDLAKVKNQIPKIANLDKDAKGELDKDTSDVQTKLAGHVDELARIAKASKAGTQAKGEKEALLQDEGARQYYLSFVSGLTSAYTAAKAVSSGFIAPKSGKAGDIGKAISAVSDIIPVVGAVGKILGAILQTVDAEQRKAQLENLANLFGTTTEIDRVAETVALALIRDGRNNVEADFTTILTAALAGEIDIRKNVADQLIGLVAKGKGKAAVIEEAPVVAASSGVDHSATIANLQAQMAAMAANLKRIQGGEQSTEVGAGGSQVQVFASKEANQGQVDKSEQNARTIADLQRQLASMSTIVAQLADESGIGTEVSGGSASQIAEEQERRKELLGEKSDQDRPKSPVRPR